MIHTVAGPRLLLLLATCGAGMLLSTAAIQADQSQPVWSSEYAATMAAADRQSTRMLVYFYDEGDPSCRRFEEAVAGSEAAQGRLAACRCVRLTMDTQIISGGQRLRLIDHPAFSNLKGGPGLVVLDFTVDDAAQRGRVLRTMPLGGERSIGPDDLAFLPSLMDKADAPGQAIAWRSDYATARAQAELEGRMLLIYFARRDGKGGSAEFETRTLSDSGIRSQLTSYVCLKLAHDAEVNLDGGKAVLLKHRSFSEMVGLPGIAILDFSNAKSPYYGQVVSTFPFLQGRAYEPRQMNVILGLPPGKLTQRTLIYAVRTHPDNPRSTSGEFDQYLASEAESHSNYQARIRLQGHHTWESRFQRITARLSGGLLATEVCAESWPGQSLLEAAIDCVRCWRLSSGHWRSVSAAHPVFGFDMRRGSNGIWYATGIFGKGGR